MLEQIPIHLVAVVVGIIFLIVVFLLSAFLSVSSERKDEMKSREFAWLLWVIVGAGFIIMFFLGTMAQ